MELTSGRRPQAIAEAIGRHDVRINRARAAAAAALFRLVRELERRVLDPETTAKDVTLLTAELRAIESSPVPEVHLHNHPTVVEAQPEALTWLAELAKHGNGKPE